MRYKYQTPQFTYWARCMRCDEVIHSLTMDEFKTLITRHRKNLPPPLEYSQTWVATYVGSRCHNCGNELLDGETCRYLEGEPMHAECAQPAIDASETPMEPCYLRRRAS